MKWIGADKSQATIPTGAPPPAESAAGLYSLLRARGIQAVDVVQRPPPQRTTCAPTQEPRAAFLVIHGIGEQNPYETLDPFVRGFHDLYRSRGLSPALGHHVAERTDAQGDPWAESFVTLDADGVAFDVHEYYWAPLTEERMPAKDIWRWFSTSVGNAQALQREEPELAAKLVHMGDLARRAFAIGRAVKRTYPLWWLLRHLASAWKGWDLLKGALRWAEKSRLKGYVEDLAIYNSMDAKSEYFAIRNKMIAQGQALLHGLCADPRYGRVILAGHSLGSAIAYDVLNRTAVQSSIPGRPIPGLGKVAQGGLVTFGSPLDEIRFFFLAKTGRDEWVRRQVLGNLHSFRAVDLRRDGGQPRLANPVQDPFAGLKWLNVHSPQDPISGSLELFAVDANVARAYPGTSWVGGHNAYWGDPGFYAELDRRFLGGQTPGPAIERLVRQRRK